MIRSWDVSLFRLVNGWPDSQAPFWVFFSDATKRTDGLIVIGIALVVMLIRPESRRTVLLALLAVALANETTDILKAVWPIPRPCNDLTDVHLRGGLLTSMGTASAHSANMAAVAMASVLTLRWWGLPWVMVALFTGLSRMYVGVHYPMQVFTGWVVGCFWALCVVGVANWIGEAWRLRHPKSETVEAEA